MIKRFAFVIIVLFLAVALVVVMTSLVPPAFLAVAALFVALAAVLSAARRARGPAFATQAAPRSPPTA